jgi:hypothetical protein
MISDNKINQDIKIVADNKIKPSRPRGYGSLVLNDLGQNGMRVPRGNVHLNTMNYLPLEQKSNLYQNKFFGNDEGLSLDSVVYSTQKYTKVFGPDVEHFQTMNPYMKSDEVKRRGYFKDSIKLPDKSLEPFKNDNVVPVSNQMIEDRSQRLQRSLSQTAPTWPHKYFQNKKGHSLEKVRENYKNYENKRHFRDGYKKLDKKLNQHIRSGPFLYNENDFGHSLQKMTDREQTK